MAFQLLSEATASVQPQVVVTFTRTNSKQELNLCKRQLLVAKNTDKRIDTDR